MTLHLIKLWVGHTSLKDLLDYQRSALKHLAASNQTRELMHVTRNFPKRAQELLDGGSIYWVIKNTIVGRQRIVDLQHVVKDDLPHCAIIYDKEFVHVQMRPHRPFQGWRYLEGRDAPPDVGANLHDHDMPEEVKQVLSELNLL